MIIIDKALENCAKEGKPIRTGIVGSGFIGSHLALQIAGTAPGIRLSALCSRNLDHAKAALKMAGIPDYVLCHEQVSFDRTLEQKKSAACDDYSLLCRSPQIDVVVEATGTIDYGARVAMEAIGHGKHIILCNAELHATLGPILKVYADKAGVVLSDMDGDQPGVTMNLYRSVVNMGFKPVLCGNIKGMLDHYRTPATQEGFARRWGMTPTMVTSFADGSKIAFEQAVIANATGMHVGVRGMFGPTAAGDIHIENSPSWYSQEVLEAPGGVVDFVIGAWPPAGVFVIAKNDHPIHRQRLELYKLGAGPYYVFSTQTHLCAFETINTIARAQLFQDAAVAPAGPPAVGVMAAAKTDLKAGTRLDGIGGYNVYGLCENARTMIAENLLPLGLAEGCVLKRDLPKDAPLFNTDVQRPAGRLCDRLEKEQNNLFFC
jgi:predicted homoserine dehydrogenase-like protein